MERFSFLKSTGKEMTWAGRWLGIFITFHLVCFGWIFFRASSMTVVGEMLSQIIHQFHPQVFMQFVAGYKVVCLFMLTGFLLHFTPRRMVDYCTRLVTRSPLLMQVLIMVLAIFLIVQVKSAGVQPFIYFDF